MIVIPSKYELTISFRTEINRFKSGEEYRSSIFELPLISLSNVNSLSSFTEFNLTEIIKVPVWPTIIYGAFQVGTTNLSFEPFKFSFFTGEGKILFISRKTVQICNFVIDSPGSVIAEPVTIPGCIAACLLADCLPIDGIEFSKSGTQSIVNRAYTIKKPFELNLPNKSAGSLNNVDIFEFPNFYFNQLTAFENFEVSENLGNRIVYFKDSQVRSQFKFSATTINNDNDFNLLIGFFVRSKGRFGTFYIRTYQKIASGILDNQFIDLPFGLKAIMVNGAYYTLSVSELGYTIDGLTLSADMRLELVLYCRFDSDELIMTVEGNTRSFSLTLLSL